MVETKFINTERVLSPTQISLAGYTINPYRGCEFGCIYCYSQQNKNIQGKNFKNYVGIKLNAPSVLEKELEIKKPKNVLLGSTTECFQYIEKKYRLTEKILKILNKNNITYTILTKSSLIKDYLELIGQNKDNKIYFTLNFAPQRIINVFEDKSSSLQSRLNAINEITKKKINLRIHLGPFIPYISNLESILALLPKSIKEIDIELYHNKMGNFKEILKKTEKKIDPRITKKLFSVYQSKANYYKYTQSLKNKILKVKKNNPAKFFYIVPDFSQFYKPVIDYNNQLK